MTNTYIDLDSEIRQRTLDINICQMKQQNGVAVTEVERR